MAIISAKRARKASALRTRFMGLVPLLGAALVPAPAQAADPAHPCGLHRYSALITHVHDGDTVTADIDLGFSLVHADQRIRLYGIDAPSLRGQEREAGLAARDALSGRVLGRRVTLCSIDDARGKYGRTLARLYVDGTFVNAWLVFRGHARPRHYD